MIWIVIIAGAILLIGGSALTASSATGSGDAASSGKPLSDFARAIGVAEGYGKPGARPTRNNNPGDMIFAPPASNYTSKSDGRYAVFDNPQDGWQALEDELDFIRRGVSAHYKVTMTFFQMANVYAEGDANWAVNVAREVGAEPSETIEGYL
jgi:hypothetical protein